jgi:hypothetical protein
MESRNTTDFGVSGFSHSQEFKGEWNRYKKRMQVACERMGQIESQIQARNAFVSGFMSGIVATFIVFAASLLLRWCG